MSAARETRRQLLHLGMTGWIVALRWLSPVEAMWLAVAAVALNWIVLPVAGVDRAQLRRPGEPFVDGVKLYPVAVLLALIVFPYPAAAAGWAVMGVGDAASNLIGRRLGKAPFLGRDDRSLAGSAAFLLLGAPAAFAAAAWVGGMPADALGVGLAAGAAALAGAAMEYVPWPRPLEDNLPITLAAAGTFALLG